MAKVRITGSNIRVSDSHDVQIGCITGSSGDDQGHEVDIHGIDVDGASDGVRIGCVRNGSDSGTRHESSGSGAPKRKGGKALKAAAALLGVSVTLFSLKPSLFGSLLSVDEINVNIGGVPPVAHIDATEPQDPLDAGWARKDASPIEPPEEKPQEEDFGLIMSF